MVDTVRTGLTKLGYLINVGPQPDGKIVIEINAELNDMRENLFRRIIDTQETATREALVQLGWTPPAAGGDAPSEPAVVHDREHANRGLELATGMAGKHPAYALTRYALPALQWAMLRIACLEANTTPVRSRDGGIMPMAWTILGAQYQCERPEGCHCTTTNGVEEVLHCRHLKAVAATPTGDTISFRTIPNAR